MYEAPGSSIKHIVIDKEVALGKKSALCFARGADAAVEAALSADDRSLGARDTQQQLTGGQDDDQTVAEAVSV